MGLKTKQQKETELAEAIEELADSGEVVSLDRDALAAQFSDDEYSEGDIKEILDELVDDSPIDTASVQLEVIYPSSYKESLFNEFEISKDHSLGFRLVLGLYLYFLFTVSSNTLQSLLSVEPGQIIIVTLLSLISAYLIGTITVALSDKVEQQIPIIRRYRLILYPFFLIMAFSFAVTLAGAAYYGKEIPLTALASLPATSIVASVAIAKFLQSDGFDVGNDSPT